MSAAIDLLKAALSDAEDIILKLADNQIDLDADEDDPARIAADFMVRHRKVLDLLPTMQHAAENELLKAARRAVVALAHVANSDTKYVDSYCDLSNAIEAAVAGGLK